MRTYLVSYRMYKFDTEKSIEVVANSRREAEIKGEFEIIPEIEGEYAYSVWATAYITKSGKVHEFANYIEW